MTVVNAKGVEYGWVAGENGWGDPMNENLVRLSALTQATALSATTTAQPGSPSDGDAYIIPSGATGAVWAAHVGKYTQWNAELAEWVLFTPTTGWQVSVVDTALVYWYTGSAWQALYGRIAGGAVLPGQSLKLGTDASGADAAASDFTAQAPLSTGNATPAALVWEVGTQGSSGSTPQTLTEGFRVQEVANASGREVALWNPSGPVMGAVPSDASSTLLRSGDGMRAWFRHRVLAAAAIPSVQLSRVNGSAASPTAVVSGNTLALFGANAYDGSSFVDGAYWQADALENWGPSNRGTDSSFFAVPIGSASPLRVVRFRAASGAGELVSGQNTLRLIPGSTGIAYRDSTNAADTFSVNAAGTTVTFPVATAFVVGADHGGAALGRFGGDVSITDTNAYYLGPTATDGTWRFIRSGNDLLIQRRESGSYVTKSTIAA